MMREWLEGTAFLLEPTAARIGDVDQGLVTLPDKPTIKRLFTMLLL